MEISPNLAFFGNSVSIEDNLIDIEDYVKEFSTHIERNKKSIADRLNTDTNTHELEELEHQYHYAFNTMFYDSIYISIFTLIEIELGKYCKDFKKYGKSQLGLSELKGDLLGRFKTYSKKVIDIQFDFGTQVWEYIARIQEIRNCLVHNAGQTEGYPKEKLIKAFIENREELKIGESGHIQICRKSCEIAIQNTHEFFLQLTEQALLKFPGDYGPSFIK